MAVAVLENDYFLDLLAKIPKDKVADYSPFTILPGGVATADDFLKYMISFAFSLEQINKLARQDTDFLELLIKIYKVKRHENNFYRLSNLLGMIKFHSIELPLVNFLKAKKEKKLSTNFGKFILTLNIFEATLVDLAVAFFDNARLGAGIHHFFQ